MGGQLSFVFTSGLCVYRFFVVSISLLLELRFPQLLLFILSLPHLFTGTFYIDLYCLLSLAFPVSSLVFFFNAGNTNFLEYFTESMTL